MLMFLAVSCFAANPFLDAPDDNPDLCQISRNRMERRHRQNRNPSHCQSSDNASGKNAVGRDLQTRIHGSKIER